MCNLYGLHKGRDAIRRAFEIDRDQPVEEEHRLYASLSCPANGVVGPEHPKAMPVPPTTPEEWHMWHEVPAEIALERQRPLPDDAVREVARGRRSDSDAMFGPGIR